MKFFLSALRKDLTRWTEDAGAILLWMFIPLLIGGLITSLMAGGGAKPHGLLLIVDQDESLMSGLVAGAYSQGELGELLSVEKVMLDEGTQRIDAGEASGLLVIPEGFMNAFLDAKPVTLTLRTNPSQTILPGIIRDVTEILLDIGFYAERLLGDELELIKDAASGDDVSETLVASLSVAIQKKVEAVAPLLFPPAIKIEIAKSPEDEPSVPMALLFLPGVILMAIVFVSNHLASDYWAERELGTLRRLVSSPAPLSGFLAGKALAAGVVITLVCGLALIIGFIYHGLAWGKLPVSLMWISISGIALFSWLGALQMTTTSQQGANLISSMIIFPLLMIGGSFFPLDALPDWIAAIGRRTPNGFIADRLTLELVSNSAWAIDIQSWLIVLAMAVSGLSVCAWRLQTSFTRD